MKANYEEPSMEIIEISDGNVTTATLIELSIGNAAPVEYASDDWYL